ncbi:LysR family transcriptional regulator [Thermoactinospora rubra]|uniref:LysR family transcriptional regulator n=1 Tax=Thermoactinospora rubra TaxID=1088767 RepID=UPI000A116622|nr:LysR family transcriptional regulator [Thermoactinospora rubra]
MDLRQLETFRKVASVGSFTRAAAELNYAQSTVTAQIKGLEAEFNVSLFQRNGRGVQITAAGRQLLPYATKILDLAAEARHALQPDREPSGMLVVGTLESITSYRLPPLLELFRYRYPRLRLSLRATPGAEALAALRAGTFDAAFLMDEQCEHRGLTTVVLREEPLTLVAAPGHPLAAEPEITLDQLRRTDILSTEPGCSYRDKLAELLSDADGEQLPMLEFGTIEAVKRTAQAGLGVALLPRIVVAAELAEGSLVRLPWRPPFRVYSQLAWNEKAWLSPELQVFVSEAIRVVNEGPEG